MKLQSLLSIAVVLALTTPVTAQDFAAQQKAMSMIGEFADTICESAPLKGQSSGAELTGGAKAELSGLLKKLADVSVEGEAKSSSREYQGVLQKDLAITIKNAQDCKLEVFRDLKDKLIPEVTSSPSSPKPSHSVSPALDLSGTYRYFGQGVAEVTQKGNDVHMFLTWTPAGKGPHYEIKAKLVGNILEGEWYSYYQKKGWYYFYGEVSPSGGSINFANSEDPIDSNMNKTRLIKIKP